MSTSAETSTPARKVRGRLPVYKRRRRRIYGAAALVLAVIVGVVVWATTGGGSGSTSLPSFTISVSQGSVASPDSIIESQTSLAKLIPANLHYVPFEAGVTAIAEMRSGAVQAISGVGNPPLTEAIGSGTGVTVVMALGLRRRPAARARLGDVARPAGRQVRRRAGRLLRGLRAAGLPRAAAPDRQGQGGRRSPTRTRRARPRCPGAVDAAYVYGSPATKLHGQGLPPAGQRPADRQARHPRPERDRGRVQRDQEQPGARAGLRVRRAAGQPGHDRAAGGEVPGRRARPCRGSPATRSSRRPRTTRSSCPATSCTGSAPRRTIPAAASCRPTCRRASSWSTRDG